MVQMKDYPEFQPSALEGYLYIPHGSDEREPVL